MDSSIARGGVAKGKSDESGNGVNAQFDRTIQKQKASRNTNFSPQETSLLITLVGEKLKVRNVKLQRNLNPTPEEWKWIESQFNFKSSRGLRDKQTLRNRWKTLRSDYSFFEDLASRSGHGWNEEDGIPDVTSEAWEEYIKIDEKRYKPYRHKKFPWFRAMEEICENNIATDKMQHTSNSSIPVTHHLDSDGSDNNQNYESHDIDDDFFSEFQQIVGDDNLTCSVPHANSLMSPVSIGTETIRIDSAMGKRKRDDTGSSRDNKKNSKNSKTEIAHTFLKQQKSRNESLD